MVSSRRVCLISAGNQGSSSRQSVGITNQPTKFQIRPDDRIAYEYMGRIRGLEESMGTASRSAAKSFSFLMWNCRAKKKNIVAGSYIQCVSSRSVGAMVSTRTEMHSEEFVTSLKSRLLVEQTTHNSARFLKVLSVTGERIELPGSRTSLLTAPKLNWQDKLTIFTDGSLKSMVHSRNELFGAIPRDTNQYKEARAGAVTFRDLDFMELITIPTIPNEVSCLSSYITEAVGVIGVLAHLRDRAIGALIVMDCESLYKAIQTYRKAQHGPLDQHMTECPYVTTIHNLAYRRGITFKWVRSHPENRKREDKFDFYERGNFMANLAAEGKLSELNKRLNRDVYEEQVEFDVIAEQLKGSMRYTVLHGGVPVNKLQIRAMNEKQQLIDYLSNRQVVSGSRERDEVDRANCTALRQDTKYCLCLECLNNKNDLRPVR